MKKKKFLEETMEMLDKSSLSVYQIAGGSDVGYRWLCKVRNGEIEDPGVKRIQRVYDYLAANVNAIPR